MRMHLTRHRRVGDAVIGALAVDGVPYVTLEDLVRAPGVKIPGRTAIPAGEYRVVMTLSQRFGRYLPLLLDVPGFTGIRIHSGNSASDTGGCILVGKRVDKVGSTILESHVALVALMRQLDAALERGEDVSIVIADGDGVTE